MELVLCQTQKQVQVLSPQMILSAQILQMGIQELREYISEAVSENPLLDSEPVSGSSGSEDHQTGDELLGELEWLKGSSAVNLPAYAAPEENDPLANAASCTDGEDDLAHYVFSQFECGGLEPELMAALKFLVWNLDANGYLDGDVSVLARAGGFPEDVTERALRTLQSASPAGVGARNLSECLRLQLRRLPGDHKLAEMIAKNHLDDLARGRCGAIKKALGASEREVREACELIRTLNPKPGSGFSTNEKAQYIIPDLTVLAAEGGFKVIANYDALPRLKISSYYIRLLRETSDREVKDYLKNKVSQAKWVVGCIDRHWSTLLECARWIVAGQEAFFSGGSAYLRPMSMGDAAEALGVHISTVSRTVKDKYIQCDKGVYPLAWFFSRPLGMEESSPEAAKTLLKRLVEAEGDKALSDQKLSEEMSRQGCSLSRRTVAKYRDELGIPNASCRRRMAGK